jgi:UDP-N-acetylmuramoyl-tripeptide--D-alanyl-D-alanine ligase
MSTVMMTLKQALAWLPGARLVGAGSTEVRRVHTDTRSLAAGDFFVALRGERFDGNEFLAQAQTQGAAAALCEPAGEAALKQLGLPGLLVPDARLALGQLAQGWRQQFKLPLIAVTGSNGKTTVTQMIASILQAYKPDAMLATQGNLNNEIGVPLTLLRLRAQHEIGVVELGMNHPGEIAVLAAMAQPTVALVNNAQREHLEFMASIEAVANENGAVLKKLSEQGVAVFPASDSYSPLWAELASGRKQMTFALHGSKADVSCAEPVWHQSAWFVNAQTPQGTLHYRLRIAGLHNVKNSLAAVTCALASSVPLESIRQGLEAFEPVKGRSKAQVLTLAGHTITLVDDSYNANPDSVKAAIDVLAGLPGPRLLVLGDMGEVGHEGPRLHAELGDYARSCGIELLFGLGEMTAKAVEQFGTARQFTDMASLNQATREALPTVASVLVKGSRFMRMEQVVQAILADTQAHQEETHAH